MIYLTDKKFEKELKILSKKFHTLSEDLENLKKLCIDVFHNFNMNNGSVFKISECCNDKFESYIVKKITCKSIHNRGCKSGIRVTYILNKEKQEITFMEIYFKQDKEFEDKKRLKEFIDQ